VVLRCTSIEEEEEEEEMARVWRIEREL